MIKTLLKSKAFWTGVASLIAGVVYIINGDTEQGTSMLSIGFTAIFLRNAIEKKGASK